MENILTVSNISKSYGKAKVLDGVTINVPKGSIYGLIGKNGAGKTTLMRIISGLQEPDDGHVEYGKCKIGALINTPALFDHLTAYENLKTQYITLGLTSYDSIPELLKLVGLDNTGKKPVRKFSFGMKQRLGVAIAMTGNPDIVLLDEPINGLDPQGIVEMREMFLNLNKKKGTTFIISSHILDELSKVATKYAFIDSGKIVKEVSSDEIVSGASIEYRATLSDVSKVIRKLDENDILYAVLDEKNIRIKGDVSLKKMNEIVEACGCELLEYSREDTSLEGYYINLVEG